MLTASDDGTARLWDAETGASLAILERHTAEVSGGGLRRGRDGKGR